MRAKSCWDKSQKSCGSDGLQDLDSILIPRAGAQGTGISDLELTAGPESQEAFDSDGLQELDDSEGRSVTGPRGTGISDPEVT